VSRSLFCSHCRSQCYKVLLVLNKIYILSYLSDLMQFTVKYVILSLFKHNLFYITLPPNFVVVFTWKWKVRRIKFLFRISCNWPLEKTKKSLKMLHLNLDKKVRRHTERFTDLHVQAKFPDSGSILGSSQFSILTQLPPKTLFHLKVVKIDPKIIVSLH